VFATLLVAVGTGPATEQAGSTVRFVLAALIGAAVCALAGALGYFAVIQPFLARGSTLGWVAATLALGFAIRAVIEAVFERPTYVFPDPIPFDELGHEGLLDLAGAQVRVRAFFVIAVACALAALAAWLLRRGRLGRGVAAIIDDPAAAQIVGVPVEAFRTAAFAVVGAIAALAALVAAPSAPFDAQSGALLGLKGLLAALLVGFAGFSIAFVAGIALGLAEAAIANDALGSIGIGPGFREVLPIAIVIAVLALRPPRDALEEVG
jgi:branched-chain amino acid transport system permease protein